MSNKDKKKKWSEQISAELGTLDEKIDQYVRYQVQLEVELEEVLGRDGQSTERITNQKLVLGHSVPDGTHYTLRYHNKRFPEQVGMHVRQGELLKHK